MCSQEAAKQAQQEKLASRGYGELVGEQTGPAGSRKPAAGFAGDTVSKKGGEVSPPSSYAEALAAAVKQREAIVGMLTDKDYENMEKMVKAAYPGLQ